MLAQQRHGPHCRGVTQPARLGLPQRCPPALRDWLLDENLDRLPNNETRAHMAEDIARYLFAAAWGNHAFCCTAHTGASGATVRPRQVSAEAASRKPRASSPARQASAREYPRRGARRRAGEGGPAFGTARV